MASPAVLASALVLLALTGCSLMPAPVHPDVAIPGGWHYAPPSSGDQTGHQTGSESGNETVRETVGPQWWMQFGNLELDATVDDALSRNGDLAAAVARVRQAQASSRVAGAPLWPSLSGFADAGRQGGILVDDSQTAGSAFDLGLAASYELDFWGRNRALRDAAVARNEAAGFDRDTVRLTLSADVTNTWLQTVALRERAALARRNLQTAADILRLVESQYRAGAGTRLDVAQQRGLVATQRRQIAALDQQINDTDVQLATLTGSTVSRDTLSAASLDAVRLPSFSAGIPSALLTQRPDLARAEAQLKAADADIAAARAAMLPSLTLTGSVGVGGDRVRTLFDNSLYSVAAGLTAPIFAGGALAAGRDLAVAQREELLATYRQAIVAAFGDTERSLNAGAGADAQYAAQREALDEAQRAIGLAQSRYQAGAETLLVVLDAQRTAFDAEDETVQLRLARLQASVALARAVGGGWQAPGQ
ncbi:efflux transporter outer membrane subunit [Paraburkholderia sp. BCC1886]|uniref:efflux transporter outer membrane subunit n=1 Tax=Paraburkholderia sp. BCC1886 TaxID=2562670 RepID=UPI0016423C94|nr:efflux transporter outer membrane subunit [Paraburkholderia sp. BCC1886]